MIKSVIPDVTYVDQFIIDGQSAVLSLKNFYESMLIMDSDKRNHIIRVPWYDTFLKYRSELSEYVQLYNVPDTMMYQPKSVSMELYGTTELWLALLRLNGMRNITEFIEPMIEIYNPTQLMELLTIFFKREGKTF